MKSAALIDDRIKENENGDLTFHLYGDRDLFKWLEIDAENMKPVQKYVHPVNYETGKRKVTILKNKIKKARFEVE